MKAGCSETTASGHRLEPGQTCLVEVGPRSELPPPPPSACRDDGTRSFFTGMVYGKGLADTNRCVVHWVKIDHPYPSCMTGSDNAERWGRRVAPSCPSGGHPGLARTESRTFAKLVAPFSVGPRCRGRSFLAGWEHLSSRADADEGQESRVGRARVAIVVSGYASRRPAERSGPA